MLAVKTIKPSGFNLFICILAIALMTLGTFTYALYASLSEVRTTSGRLQADSNYLKLSYLGQSISTGYQGAFSPFSGGFTPNHSIKFKMQISSLTKPDLNNIGVKVNTPNWLQQLQRPGSNFASHEATQIHLEMDQLSQDTFQVVIQLKNISEQFFATLPLQIKLPDGVEALSYSLPPDHIEQVGQLLSWGNISPGLFNYLFHNYRDLNQSTYAPELGHSLIFSWLYNSIFIVICKLILSMVIAVVAGYLLSKYSFSGRRPLIFLLVFSLAIPPQAIFISNYMLFSSVDLLNSPWALILMCILSAQVLLMKHFFDGLDKNLLFAARVDGATHWQIFRYIYLPQAKPALISVAVLTVQSAWNDFFWPFILLTAPESTFTLPLGLLSLRNSVGMSTSWGSLLAACFISVFPMLLLFIFCRRSLFQTMNQQWHFDRLMKKVS
ncbi:carbohydrate ABC transporter permease [Gayadomonas joobiniege]|uniref:carbohydrate ABC transporter permease n=1 Tax=Gayadomonas joobiniege TaxID=1234606 RepID=UPI0003656DDB|nr:carbohydrate ABC transporter permease [Gayadomonas joobiniege]